MYIYVTKSEEYILPAESRSYYDAISEGYDALYGEEQQEKLEQIKELLKNDIILEPENDCILLDIGCGTGISTSDFQVVSVGLDPANNLLKKANDLRLSIKSGSGHSENNASRVSVPPDHLGYILGVAEALPIKTKSCTIVISVTAVHNFRNINKGLQEINRIAKNRVVITVLKRAKMFDEIVEIINQNFQVLKSIENRFDLILYLAPKN
jgi:ubiquinone/menaquinone biosynthesis C-methylase UbiE